jgi:signal transduction histidine kinase
LGILSTAKPKGTGLDWRLVRRLLNTMGAIWFESEPGKGSVFSFSLPVINLSEQISMEDIHQDYSL